MVPARRIHFPSIVSAFLLVLAVWTINNVALAVAGSSLDEKVGVAYRDENRLLLDIPNSNIKDGTPVAIFALPEYSLFCCAKVGQMSRAGAPTVQQAIFDKGNTSTYRLEMDPENNDIRFGFAVADPAGVFSGKSGKVWVDVNRDGVEETFRDCTSHEGVHLTIWSGEPLKGLKLWHAYFYLGYDTEPSCVQADVQ